MKYSALPIFRHFTGDFPEVNVQISSTSRFPMPMPFGWFGIDWSDTLAVGESRAVRFFGQDLVLFRSESGKACVLEAYCPHLGAHLGFGIHENMDKGGGRIEGESIACPFHAWKFNGEGECTDVPYAKNMPPKVQGKKCLKSFEVVETNQMIYVWYHPEGVAPMWEVAVHEEANSPDWAPFDRKEWIVKSHNQEMAENAADPAHFRYVHGTASMPDWEINYDGPVARGLQRAKMTTPRGDVNGEIHTFSKGPGQGSTRFKGIAETFLLSSTVPVDENTVRILFGFSHPMVNGEPVKGGVNAAIVKDVCKQFEEDKPIWENKIYRALPVLCDGDGPIAKFRKWYTQFYAGGFDPKSV